MLRGTQDNPIHQLRFDHIVGLRGGKVYYKKLSDTWTHSMSLYCYDKGIELIQVRDAGGGINGAYNVGKGGHQ